MAFRRHIIFSFPGRFRVVRAGRKGITLLLIFFVRFYFDARRYFDGPGSGTCVAKETKTATIGRDEKILETEEQTRKGRVRSCLVVGAIPC